ncbi:MAG: GNAT family N-acetyltransferase [Candidatus Bathyarchaeota archaeon]|nr:GNAT family N-acetyltransferase [Candidatus Bathyarchaeota archaeon]
MSISIKKAKVHDLEKLYRIEKECFTSEAFSKEQTAFLLGNPNSISLLAQMNDEIVGFIIALIYERNNEKAGHVFTLDVAIKARRRGVGLRLLWNLEQILRSKGVNVCYLEVKVDNVAARELYKKLGYVEIEHLKDHYYLREDGVRLRKILQ